MVVGAFALAFHGVPRYTGDIDLLVRPTTENAGRVVRLGVAPNPIDLLTSISGVPFEEAWQDRVEAELDGVPVAFLSHECLIRNKRAAGRAQDRADLDALEGGR